VPEQSSARGQSSASEQGGAPDRGNAPGPSSARRHSGAPDQGSTSDRGSTTDPRSARDHSSAPDQRTTEQLSAPPQRSASDREHLAALDAAAHRAAADPTPAGADAAIDALPWLGEQIAQDRARGTFAAWGRSTVVDENTGTPVLAPAVLAALQRRAGMPAEFPGSHAGLAHVYGYLLSVERTPYGLKRDRWTGGTLSIALGHDPRHLLPWHRPDGRTLLQRVTDAALPLLSAAPDAPGTLLHRDDPVPGTTNALRTVVHRAQGVPGSIAALVYGLVGPAGTRLVTIFPVDCSPVRLRELAALAPVPRYNVLLDAPQAVGG
jgi:hypothetical protein